MEEERALAEKQIVGLKEAPRTFHEAIAKSASTVAGPCDGD